jgi:hypothetical protein
MNFCAEPSCVGLAATGKWCPLHITDNYEKRRNAARPELDKWYGKRAWGRVRAYKLRRFPMCEKEGCDRPATDVHHMDGSWKISGDWRLFIDQENLEALCHQHHSAITIQEMRQCKKTV